MPVEFDPEAAPALELSRIAHRFGRVTAIDDVDLAVMPGEIVCLVGPSGCGKSTLLRVAAGLEELQAGTVRIDGRVVAAPGMSLPPERRGIGLVFQDYALFPHLTVLDNVRFGLPPGNGQRARAIETLRQVGMEAFGDAYPHMLSGGQQQRVALARALAPQPRVLLLDEPFSGLDTRLRGQVRDETLHVLKRNGAATMIVTHDPEEAMFLSDRIALMREGRIVQIGSPVDLYCRPVDAFAASFFGEVNRLRGVVREGRVDTPLGPVDATHLPEGTSVEVLVRPEAMALSLNPTGEAPIRGRVEAARLLGRTSLVHLSVPNGDGAKIHIHARMPGQFLPPEESDVAIRLDPAQTFIFPD
jgi:iron(III) transport system ATP-binding protein